MRTVYTDDNLLVIDEFLPLREHEALATWVDSCDVERAGGGRWLKVYQPNKKAALHGERGFSYPPRSDKPIPVYPFGDPRDAFCDALTEAAPSFSRWIGSQHFDWEYYGIRLYVYEPEVPLSWHGDQLTSGAFTYYLHRQWGTDWGGELVVSTAQDHSVGVTVSPVPNRLIVLRPPTLHKIIPHERSGVLRCSIQGFFYDQTAFDKATSL